jgi:hypothetical protein
VPEFPQQLERGYNSYDKKDLHLLVLSEAHFELFKVHGVAATGAGSENVCQISETETIVFLLDLHAKSHVDSFNFDIHANTV